MPTCVLLLEQTPVVLTYQVAAAGRAAGGPDDRHPQGLQGLPGGGDVRAVLGVHVNRVQAVTGEHAQGVPRLPRRERRRVRRSVLPAGREVELLAARVVLRVPPVRVERGIRGRRKHPGTPISTSRQVAGVGAHRATASTSGTTTSSCRVPHRTAHPAFR